MAQYSPILRLALVASSFCALLCSQEADLAKRLFQSGERAYALKSYSEALDTWNQLVAQAPDSPFTPIALFRMATYQHSVANQPHTALSLLGRIKTEHMKSPVAPEALLLRGQLLAQAAKSPSEMTEAISEFHRVVDIFPRHESALQAQFELGLAAQKQGQWRQALPHFMAVLQLDPGHPTALGAMWRAAEALNALGDLNGCLAMLQRLVDQAPQSAEAQEATQRISLLVKHRIQKKPFMAEGPWPKNAPKWKTPTLLACLPTGDCYVYQSDAHQASLIQKNTLCPVGPVVKGAKAMAIRQGKVWLLSERQGLLTDTPAPALTLPSLRNASGLCVDPWERLWICDEKRGGLTLVDVAGMTTALPAPPGVALASLPGGGVVMACDDTKNFVFFDEKGKQTFSASYHDKHLPARYRNVMALSSDGVGHLAAIVDGDFYGVVLLAQDGTALRQSTFKELGLRGRFRAIGQDPMGGILLADRSNDVIIRLQ